MFKVFSFVGILLIFCGCVDDTIETNIRMAQCISKYPNYETTQKLEFEKCLNE